MPDYFKSQFYGEDLDKAFGIILRGDIELADQRAKEAATSAAAAKTSETNAEHSRQAIENLGVEGATLPAGSQVAVEKAVAEDGTVTLKFSIPQGIEGEQGNVGAQGVSIVSIRRTAGTGAAGTTDTYTIALSDGSTSTFQVYNGADGTGAGDMRMEVYDPTNKARDVFAYADKLKTFDVVIRTQAEFEALIASPDWLGAVSVCFVGDGGALKFTSANAAGIKIPATVKQIQGMNAASITVTTDRAALWYTSHPTGNTFWIRDLKVMCIGVGSAFYNCTNLTNCIGEGSGGGGHGTGFDGCDWLINCTGTGTGGRGTGFVDCTDLINCTGNGSGSNGRGIAFQNCTRLTGCTGTGSGAGTGGNGYAFDSCTQVSNCTGTGIGTEGYGFRRCDYVDNCKEGPTPSTTAPYMECTFVGATLEDVPKTANDLGAAPADHKHSTNDMTSGTLPVPRGGTGLSSVTSGNILMGNGTGSLTARPVTSLTPKIGLGYGVCNTAAATTIKEVPVTDFNLVDGARVAVYFNYDVPADAVLRVNGTTACAMWFCTKRIAAGVIRAKDMVEFVFAQNRWYVLSIDRMSMASPAVLGSYTGTGVYGESNPNHLVFQALPKMVILAIEGDYRGWNAQSVEYPSTLTGSWKRYRGFSRDQTTDSGSYAKVTFEDGQWHLWWYNTNGDQQQKNAAATVYQYVELY